MRRTAVNRVLNEYLPSVASLLKRIQVESHKVVEEVALDLTTKDVDLATKDVQSMSISSWWSWSCWQSSRPLFRG